MIKKFVKRKLMRVKTFFLLARGPLSLFVDLQDVPSTETFCERTTKGQPVLRLLIF